MPESPSSSPALACLARGGVCVWGGEHWRVSLLLGVRKKEGPEEEESWGPRRQSWSTAQLQGS